MESAKAAMKAVDVRPVTPLDLPFIRRVMALHLPLDSTTAVTRGLASLEDVLLSVVPLTDLGAPTYVLRRGENGYAGQFRHRMGDGIACLTFLAPDPREGDVYEWVRLLETLVVEAGKRGAQLVTAEVCEDHPILVAFRRAGFAVYARQTLLCRQPGPKLSNGDTGSRLRPVADRDLIAIATLCANTVPRLLQQAEQRPGSEPAGVVYEREGVLAAYLAITEGRNGIVIKPYFHPEVSNQASAIVRAALWHIPRAEQLPVYLYARAYQDWLRGALEEVAFTSWAYQALMVKNTLVRAERPEFSTLPGLETNRSPVTDGPLTLHRHKTPPLRTLWQALVQKRHKWPSRMPAWRRTGK